jgi:Xaa-Pro aminopeptidase
MQVWVAHNAVRYVFIPTQGPIVLFDFHNCEHLSQGLGTIDEVRPGTGVYYFGAGARLQEFAARWAAEIADLLLQHGGGNRRLALDHTHHYAVAALERHGVEIFDAQQLLEQARLLKSAEELQCMRAAIGVCQQAMQRMHEEAEPGMTENAVWSLLHQTNIALGGEWIETRLLTSGERTNPWFQECGFRTIRQGDLICYDTDLIGPYGYCADLSRSFVCAARASDRQRQLYAMAYQQIHANLELLRPGMGLREFAELSYPLPQGYRNNRYSVVAHGVGLCDEYPVIVYPQDFEHGGYDDVIQPGMTLCVESYIGEDGGEQGIKLEQQVLVTGTGVEVLSDFPFDENLLGREM